MVKNLYFQRRNIENDGRQRNLTNNNRSSQRLYCHIVALLFLGVGRFSWLQWYRPYTVDQKQQPRIQVQDNSSSNSSNHTPVISTATTVISTATATTSTEREEKAKPTTGPPNLLKSDDNNDGCGVYRNRDKQGQWAKIDETDETWLRDIQSCTVRFQNMRVFADRTLKTNFEMLQCDLKITQKNLQETLDQYDTIWFFGDSILRQQYYTLLCMYNPQLEQSDFVFNEDNDPREFLMSHYIHNTTTNSRSTAFRYSKYGYRYELDELNLYQNAFPTAVRSLTKRDAIVLDGSAHYDSTLLQRFEQTLTFVTNQSHVANASMFYMDAATQEWPTSNGMFANGCWGRCTCQALTPEQLKGQWNHSQATAMAEKKHLLRPELPAFEKYVKNLMDDTNTNITEYYPKPNDEEVDCYPDCLPAPWSSEVIRAFLANESVPVDLVPVYWQFVDKGGPTFKIYNDCTHKSLEGITMMNQQLIRTMFQRQQRNEYQQRRRRQLWKL